VPIIIQGNGGVAADVGGLAHRAVNTHVKPIDWGTLGHYRVNHRCVLAAAQAANSRIFEVRNTHATNLLIPTRLTIRAIQTAAGTAQENSLDVFKVTGFSAVDTTNTVTPVASVKRGATMTAPASGIAALRGVTVAGAAAGMTGGTLTKDTSSLAQLPLLVSAAAGVTTFALDALDDVNGTHPLVFSQNEGLIIENRVLNVTSYGFSAYIDFSWAEVSAY
jgi:hypothetical protein